MTTGRESDASARRKRQRRPLGWALFAAVALLLAVAASLLARQVALGGETARRSIGAELQALTGLPVSFGGQAEFRLLPVPRLALEEVEIGRPAEGPRLTIARMTADLDLWAALLGRTRIDRLVLVSPALSAPPGASLPATFEPLAGRLHGLGEVEIRDGVLARDRAGALPLVSAANLRFSWPKEGAAASLVGSYAWNGQPVRLDLRLASPLDWLEGRQSAVDFDMTSPPLDLAFDGQASSDGRLAGRLTAALPSLPRSLRWLTATRIAVPDIGPLSIAANLTAAGGRLDLADAEVSIDGFAGRGALDLAFPEDRRPSLAGTLAFERLDLDGISEAVAPLPEAPVEAARPIQLGFVDRLDIDLRISAASGRIGSLALSDLAGTVKLKDGMATLDIGDAGLLGGNGQMRVGVDATAQPPRLKGSASMRGVDAAGLLSAFGVGSTALTGTADLAVSVEAPVTNWADIFNRHRLTAGLTARSGTLGGLDPQALRTAASASGGDAGPAQTRFDAGTGAVLSFSNLKAELRSEGPRLALDALRISSDGGTIEAAGLLVDGGNAADLEGTFEPASETSAGAALTKPKPIALTMRGSWPHPAILATAPAGGE